VWDGIKTKVGDSVAAIVEFVTGIPGKIGGLVSDFARAGGNLAGAMIDGITTGVGNLLSKATDAAKGFANAIVGFVNRNIIDKINDLVEFKIKVPGLPDININPPDLPRLPTFHSGGIVGGTGPGNYGPGLRPDELFAILQRGEMVLNADQQRNLAGFMHPDRPTVIIHNPTFTTGHQSPKRFYDEALWRLTG